MDWGWRTFLINRDWRMFALLFFASYGSYLYGAMFVVPEEQYDHDLEVQGTGYGLLTRFEPFLLTDRNTIYYFAHPPLLHYYAAASFLYYDELDHLKYYDAASQRALATRQGKPFQPPSIGYSAVRLPRGPYVEHEITGIQDGKYLISPPLGDGNERDTGGETRTSIDLCAIPQEPQKARSSNADGLSRGFRQSLCSVVGPLGLAGNGGRSSRCADLRDQP